MKKEESIVDHERGLKRSLESHKWKHLVISLMPNSGMLAFSISKQTNGIFVEHNKSYVFKNANLNDIMQIQVKAQGTCSRHTIVVHILLCGL